MSSGGEVRLHRQVSYAFGPFRLDPAQRLLLRDGQPVPLTPKAFDILLALVENRGRVLEKDELMRLVWPDTVVEESNLTQHIFTLRRVLGEGPNDHRYIATVPRHGYRFVAEVREAEGGWTERAATAPAQPTASTSGTLFAPRAAAIAIGVLAALMAAGLAFRLSQPRTAPGLVSIAVLPLDNVTHDPAQEYFSDGMTEELITDLAKIRALRVISRASVMQFKGTRKPLPEIARTLNVDKVVEGSVLRFGDRVRITAQLIDAPSDRHLWSESYERDARDVLSLQDEVAQEICRHIRVALTSEEQERLSRPRGVDPEVHILHLKGQYSFAKRTPDNLRTSIDYFTQAIAKDPSYAPSYAGLANAHGMMAIGAFDVLPPAEAMPKARAAALKALQLDESLADAHAALGWVRFNYDWDWAAAETEFRRAIELKPSYATAHQWYAVYLSAMGRPDEALSEATRALELDPLSLINVVALARAHYFARQFDRAIAACQDALQMDPAFALAHLWLGRPYEAKGMYQEAIGQYKQFATVTGRSMAALALLGEVYGRAGEPAQARRLLEEIRSSSQRTYVPAFYFALVYVGLGDRDEAFRWLDKALAERSDFMVYLNVHAGLDPLRSDPRFAALVRRVGLPQP